MSKSNKDIEESPPTEPEKPRFPRMLTLEQVQEILNLGVPATYALVRSGELRAAQFGTRRVWRVSEDDLADYLERAYKDTEERIAAGTIRVETLEGED